MGTEFQFYKIEEFWKWTVVMKVYYKCIQYHQSQRPPIPKKGNAKECSNYHTTALISHASKVMLKILQARLQQYMNHGTSKCSSWFWKGRGTRDQIAKIHWIIKKAREFQKNIYFCFNDYAKVFDCMDHNKLWKILKEMGIPDQVRKQQLELDMEQQTGSR